MRTALITGASGFVGRHTATHLLRVGGWDVAAIDTVSGLDALDYFRVSTRRWDLVVHAAASAPHRAAIDGEHQHMARNLQLDAAMFDWAVRTGQGRVLYLSSSAAYPIAYQQPGFRGHFSLHEDLIHLDNSMEPDSVYGWTKLTGERLAAQARKGGLAVTVVRPFSGYGEDQTENFPFRAIVERARRREDPFIIWGDGSQVRDFIHIDDVVQGMLAVAESGTTDPVNLCTGVGWSVTELAEMVCEKVGYTPRFAYREDMPAGVAYRVGDRTRFAEHYERKVGLAEGITRALRS